MTIRLAISTPTANVYSALSNVEVDVCSARGGDKQLGRNTCKISNVNMSEQWEVVGRNKQKQGGQGGKKLTKSERKKFVENAPKVEDILPLAQVKSLFNALDSNKENNKPGDKENHSKENNAKKAQKKQSEKKKDVKEKPALPKSLEIAVKTIDVAALNREIEEGKTKFQDTPMLFLKGLTDYLNIHLDHLNPVQTPKSGDYPLCVLPVNVRDALQKALRDTTEQVQQHFFEMCLSSMANSMSKGSSAVYGYKVMLQLLALQHPDVTVASIPKVTELRQSYQNRQTIGLAILWAVGQGGFKDFHIGVKVWLEIMLPVLDMRNYTVFVCNYLKDILAQSPHGKPLDAEQFLAVLDELHKRTEMQPLAAFLRLRAFKAEPEKRLRHFFEPLLERLRPTVPKMLKEELLTCLLLCLSSDQHCYSIWRQSYVRLLPQSSILLNHISTHWSTAQKNLPVKLLRETVVTFQATNQEMKQGKHKDELITQCQTYCEELLKRMTVSRTFPWKLGSFLLLLAFTGLLSYDINKHGSFRSSNTGCFLKDIGALQYAEHAWARTKLYSNQSCKWAEASIPEYYKILSDHAKPYLELIWDLFLIIGNQLVSLNENVSLYIKEKTPLVVEKINYYAPGLVDKIKEHSKEAWNMLKQNGLVLSQYVLEYSYIGIEWAKDNIFVGNLSPENLQKYSLEALNTTQVYAAWTYDWVCQKVQTLSKIQ